MAQRNDEHVREVEKLRVQIQSMEEEVRRLYQSRYQLDQATKQNEKLVSTLQEAKAQIEALRAEVEKLTAPPSAYAIFSSLNDDGTGNVYVSGRKMKVSVHPSINGKAMRKGQEVVLNEALNVIEVKGFDIQGEVGIQADVAQRADGDHRIRCVDRHAAAVTVLQPDHVVHVRVQRQQLGLDAGHGLRHHAGHALHGGGDGQDVAGAHRAIGVAQALEGEAVEW